MCVGVRWILGGRASIEGYVELEAVDTSAPLEMVKGPRDGWNGRFPLLTFTETNLLMMES